MPAPLVLLATLVLAAGKRAHLQGNMAVLQASEDITAAATTTTTTEAVEAALVVYGDFTAVNGEYVEAGTMNGKPKYKKRDGKCAIYFSEGLWMLRQDSPTLGDIPVSWRGHSEACAVPPEGSWSSMFSTPHIRHVSLNKANNEDTSACITTTIITTTTTTTEAISVKEAAENGDVSALAAYRKAGADLGAVVDDQGQLWTPAHFAAQWKGHAAALKFLHEAGVDIDATDRSFQTPAMLAARCGDVEALEVLRQAGANLAARNGRQQSLVHYAVQNGHAAVLRFLKQAGVDLNAPDNFQTTAAHIAAKHGDVAMLEVLHEENADLDAQNFAGETPAHLAARTGRENVLRFLVEAHANIKLKDKKGQTPAHVAAANGEAASLELLRQAGADLQEADKRGETPEQLFQIQAPATPGSIEKLVSLGVNLSKHRWTEGHTAALHDDWAEIPRLSQAALSKMDWAGRTPAHVAALENNWRTLEALVKAGAPVDAEDYHGDTPLHYAAQFGHVDALRVLNYEENPNPSNYKGATPADLAARNGKQEVLDLLLKAGGQQKASD